MDSVSVVFPESDASRSENRSNEELEWLPTNMRYECHIPQVRHLASRSGCRKPSSAWDLPSPGGLTGVVMYEASGPRPTHESITDECSTVCKGPGRALCRVGASISDPDLDTHEIASVTQAIVRDSKSLNQCVQPYNTTIFLCLTHLPLSPKLHGFHHCRSGWLRGAA